MGNSSLEKANVWHFHFLAQRPACVTKYVPFTECQQEEDGSLLVVILAAVVQLDYVDLNYTLLTSCSKVAYRAKLSHAARCGRGRFETDKNPWVSSPNIYF